MVFFEQFIKHISKCTMHIEKTDYLHNIVNFYYYFSLFIIRRRFWVYAIIEQRQTNIFNENTSINKYDTRPLKD